MSARIIVGDALESLRSLPDESVQMCVTSPPYYGLRDYGVEGQIGLESSPSEYVERLVGVVREVRRVLHQSGTLWLNVGDSYAGSGKGGNPADSPFQKQATNRGSVVRGKRMERGSGRWGGGDIAVPGCKPKDLIGVPWMLAFALRADGWYLRSEIIWAKPNPMPESVTDRPTKSHEQLFLLSRSPSYFYDAAAIAEPAGGWNGSTFDGARDLEVRPNTGRKARSGNKERKPGSARGCPEGTGSNVCGSIPWEGETRNKRDVWTVPTKPFQAAHFATFPVALIEPCILAGSKEGDTVLDPFGGAGTTALVADRLGRDSILIELNPEYAKLAEKRLHHDSPLFAEVNLGASA